MPRGLLQSDGHYSAPDGKKQVIAEHKSAKHLYSFSFSSVAQYHNDLFVVLVEAYFKVRYWKNDDWQLDHSQLQAALEVKRQGLQRTLQP